MLNSNSATEHLIGKNTFRNVESDEIPLAKPSARIYFIEEFLVILIALKEILLIDILSWMCTNLINVKYLNIGTFQTFQGNLSNLIFKNPSQISIYVDPIFYFFSF